MERHWRYYGVTGRQGYPFMDLLEPEIDFVELAGGFGVPGERITTAEQVGPALKAALAGGGPFLLDVAVGGG
jgi:acetolactate synthase-1/2/3 large subunit